MNKFIFSLLVLFFVSVNAVSENESSIQRLDAIYFDQSALVVDDTYYKMDLNMKVIASDGKGINKKLLKEGQKIIVKFSKYRAGQYQQIEEIQVVQQDK
ncbi:MAG: hypothetical protein K6L75_08730 [Cellvibrionaceae bacterium]